MGGKESLSGSSSNLWLASNPSKRWAEVFFLCYTRFGSLYRFTELEYFLLALVSAAPSFLIPALWVGKADRSLSWKDRYWVKPPMDNHFSYVGNYFWTHYFFSLGALHISILEDEQCELQSIKVPHTTFLMTHFPYYDFVDRDAMYQIGCLFYAIYFLVSFPMFLRIDEKASDSWDLPRVAIDALGAAMLVTIILDLWRIFLGPIVPPPNGKDCVQPGLVWFPGHAK
ncbi:hypothetical protein K2173_004491 [Erythroxylum novogranatense]|uniref:Cycloeucalenol cycloisomerase n=1 Tax=Erythroxylum novogranatense TaxID=1862640 RepID=A0AAV8S7R5_9ROSI|nr:hypothetical protein K2173_004491 [Erythroxylum novogranatense]